MITLIGIISNESKYIKEWLTYHQLIGFEKFYITLHDCTDDSLEVIKNLKFNVDVNISNEKNITGWHFKNKKYSESIAKVKTPWFICLDIDEFIYFPKQDYLNFLNSHEFYSAGSIAVYQNIFGNCGHEKSPSGLVIDNYKIRNEDDVLDNDSNYPHYKNPKDLFKTIKPLVKTKEFLKVVDSHNFLCKKPVVDEDGDIFKKYHVKRKTQKVRINHYFTKSKEDWIFKTSRPRLSGAKPYLSSWFEYFSKQKKEDFELSNYMKLRSSWR